MNRREVLEIVSAAAITCTPVLAAAQAYPNRPVSLLVGGAAGSVPDVLARSLSDRLAAAIGQPVIVEDKPGAAGSIAMSALTRSAPDGHTIALATMSQAVFNSYLFAKLPYDPVRDLAPVASLVIGAMVVACHPSFEARSLADLVRLAHVQPGRLFIAVPQLGSPPHVVALLLNHAGGMDVRMVPHKAGTEALNAVVSGAIPLIVEAPTTVAPLVRAGKLRALAVTGRQREPLLPDTPTAMESGMDVDGEAWIGVVAPSGTPPEVIQRLNRDLNALLQGGEVQAIMAQLGFRVLKTTPEGFASMIRIEHAKWGPAIRAAGLKLE